MQVAGLSVMVVDARQARNFANSLGVRSKTERVAARVLRQYADALCGLPERDRYRRPLPDPQRALWPC